MLKNTTTSYGWLMKLLHWTIAALVMMQFFYILKKNSLPDGDPLRGEWMMWHKSFGFTIFWLALLFITWRLMNPKPVWSSSMANWQKSLARITHLLLYVFIILMPLTGLLMGLMRGVSVNLFNKVTISATIVPQSETFATFLHSIHVLSPWILSTLILLHTLGALVHQFYYKDDVLKRML